MKFIDDNGSEFDIEFGGILGQGACRFKGFKRDPWGNLEQVEIVIDGFDVSDQRVIDLIAAIFGKGVCS